MGEIDKERIGAILLKLGGQGSAPKPEAEEEDEMHPGLSAVSHDVIDAVKRGDADGFARALKIAIRMAKD